MIWYISSSLAMALMSIIVYVYFHRKGQFEDHEEVKYQLFREDKPTDEQ